MKNIMIMTTGLTIWSMGNACGGPAFSHTIKKYINEGWTIFLITDVKTNQQYEYSNNLHIIYIGNTVFKKFCLKKKIGAFFRIADHKIITKRFEKAIRKVIKENLGNFLLYAYEIHGVKACSNIAKKQSIPFVTRFQGTILSQYENNMVNRFARYPHFQALEEKSDLIIMTDDGTEGKRVLERLHNNSDLLFIRNGLDLIEGNRVIESDCAEKLRKILSINHEDIVFLTVSRLVKWKKVDRAIIGFGEYLKNGGIGKLVIVGDGDDKHRLVEITKNLKIVEDVIFTGAVTHEDVYNYMEMADVFVSLYDLSNVGNPLLEAMTLGKCIVTLNVGDTKKLIKNNENGLLLEYEDLEELGNYFLKIANDKQVREILGSSACKYAKSNFLSWKERMNIEYEKVMKLF